MRGIHSACKQGKKRAEGLFIVRPPLSFLAALDTADKARCHTVLRAVAQTDHHPPAGNSMPPCGQVQIGGAELVFEQLGKRSNVHPPCRPGACVPRADAASRHHPRYRSHNSPSGIRPVAPWLQVKLIILRLDETGFPIVAAPHQTVRQPDNVHLCTSRHRSFFALPDRYLKNNRLSQIRLQSM